MAKSTRQYVFEGMELLPEALIPFVEKRLELAQHEWMRLKTNNSLECRNCHNLNSMDFTRQSKRAIQMHSTELASGNKTCIDCHKGIAHKLPDIKSAGAK